MSTEIGQVGGVKINTGTAAGAAYVNKITHPPSPMTAEYQGRPDCSAPNIVLMELKAEVNVPPILSFPTSPTEVKTINPSSMLFVQTSGAVVMNYIFMWLADAASGVSGWVQPQGQAALTNSASSSQPNVSQSVEPAVRSAGYNFTQWQNDIASHRKTYKSSTYYLNATNFNNQGIVTSAKFKPDIVKGSNLLTLLDSHAGDPVSSRNLVNAIKASCSNRGIDFKFEDDGFVFVNKKDGIKMPGDQVAYQIWEWGQFPNSQGDHLPHSSQIYYNTLFPATSSQLLVSSPKAATRPAREGAFVVQQQEDEVIPFISNYATSSSSIADPIGLNLSFMRYLNGQVAIYIPLYNHLTTGNTFSPLTAEVPWGSLDWSFTMFEGLTVPATTGTTLTSVPYITVKSILGLELQPRSTSSLSTFQKTLPLPDEDAIKMAIGIMHARPDSLPASANDLGTIAATAIKFIPTAVDWLKQIFGKKEAKKEVKEIKKVVRQPKTPRRDVEINNRIAALTSIVRSMQIQASKNNAPATQLPSYTETPNKNSKVKVNKGLKKAARKATPMPMMRTNLAMRQRKY